MIIILMGLGATLAGYFNSILPLLIIGPCVMVLGLVSYVMACCCLKSFRSNGGQQLGVVMQPTQQQLVGQQTVVQEPPKMNVPPAASYPVPTQGAYPAHLVAACPNQQGTPYPIQTGTYPAQPVPESYPYEQPVPLYSDQQTGTSHVAQAAPGYLAQPVGSYPEQPPPYSEVVPVGQPDGVSYPSKM